MTSWGIAKAKAQLSEIVHKAEVAGPQTLSRSGREVAVVISMSEWKKLKQAQHAAELPKESMAEFLLRSPLNGSGLKIPRLKLRPRKLDL